MKLKKFVKTMLAALAVSFGSITTAAADLQDILDSGKVRIGVPVDVVPFGFVDENNQPAGLDIDLAEMIAEAMGVDLEITQITGINRIPFLTSDKLDLVVSVMGATPERALQVSFSSPYSAFVLGVFGPDSIDVSSPEELGNYTVGVPRGSTQDVELTAMAPNANIMRFEDDATAAAAYLSGQVDLLGTGNPVAADLSKKHPEKAMTTKFVIRVAPTHIAFQQNNPELGRWLDVFVLYNKVNGKLDELSRKWLTSDLPDNFPSL